MRRSRCWISRPIRRVCRTCPVNLKPDWRNPFVDYTVEQLYASLADVELRHEPGTHYQYANVGFGLLGLALARRAEKSYEKLLVE